MLVIFYYGFQYVKVLTFNLTVSYEFEREKNSENIPIPLNGSIPTPIFLLENLVETRCIVKGCWPIRVTVKGRTFLNSHSSKGFEKLKSFR